MKIAKINLKNCYFFIFIITVIGFVLRLLTCYWGYPYQLHPDEGTIVNNAIDMLSRHSWEAYVYNRPDQFEIKCSSVLFNIISWIKYHRPAYEAFHDHKMAFFLIARFYTTLFGTAMIPLSAVFTSRLLKETRIKREIAQIFTACIVAFSPVFIQHSAYATPDVTLTFFILLFSYFFMLYIEKNRGGGDGNFCFAVS